jgi:amino acid permease
MARRTEKAIDVVVVASALAFVATFVIHGAFSCQRYVAMGWLMDAYPRYYLPLAAVVPLAGLSLLAALDHPRVRAALTGFLIAGPIVFLLLGAPLG